MSELILAVTSNCNLDCIFCYQLEEGELSRKQIERYTNLSKANHVDISGGEPFLREDLVDIIKMILDKDKTVQVITNGTIMRDDFMQLDDKTRQRISVQLSLHAARAETYKKITGHDKFSQVIQNLDRFAETYYTGLSCAIYRENIDEVPEILEIGYKRGLPVRVDLVFPVQDFNGGLLTQDEVNNLKKLLKIEKIVSKGLVDSSPLLHRNVCPVLQRVYGLEKKGECPAEAQQKLYVDPSGKEHRCEFLVG